MQVMHARLYTKSSALESAQLLLTTAAGQVLGLSGLGFSWGHF